MPPTRRRMRPPVVTSPGRADQSPRALVPPPRPAPRPPRPAPRARAPSAGSIELFAWIAVSCFALAVRLLNLDGNPLQPAESVVALDSWNIAQHLGVQLGASPVLVYANALLFVSLGATDGVARALPMFAGFVTAIFPVFLRRELGRVGALSAALILATSPTLIFASRSVDPTSLTLAFSLIFLLATLEYGRAKRVRFLYVASIVGALILMSGPPAYTMVVVLVGYLVANPIGELRPLVGIATDVDPMADREVVALRQALKGPLIAFALTIAIVGTGLGTNLEGFGDALTGPLGRWFSSLGGVSLSSLVVLPTLLLAYELLALVFGVIGVLFAVRGRRSIEGFFVWWAVVAAALFLIGDGSHPTWAAFIVTPLAVLAGRAIEELFPRIVVLEHRRDFAIFAAVVLSLFATVLIAAGNATLPEPNVPRWAAAMPVLAIIAFFICFALWSNLQSALTALAAVGLVALVGINVHASMLLNPGGPLNPAETFTGTTTSPDIRTMAADINTTMNELHIARQLEAKQVTDTVEIVSTFANPVAWYLRDWRQAQVVSSVGDSPAVAVEAADAKAPSGAYAGELFEVTTTARRPALDPIELVRWWLYRQAPSQTGTYVKVFIKTQLGQK